MSSGENFKVRIEEVKTFEQRAFCDCGEELIFGGFSSNNHFFHRCKNFHTQPIKGKSYPRTVYARWDQTIGGWKVKDQ